MAWMIAALTSRFIDEFSAPPIFGVRAPGRVNLIGEHIDYLDGVVMPIAIDRAVYAVVAPNQTEQIRLWTSITNGITTFSANDEQIREGKDYWINYLVGVLSVYRNEGIRCPGFDAVIDTDLAIGAGLSSSAALETTIALIIEWLAGNSVSKQKRALLCQRAEHEYAGVPCGIMDQMAVGFGEVGKAMAIDCRDHQYSQVAIPEDLSIIVTDTRVKHALGDGEYRQRRQDCEAALEMLPIDCWRDASIELVEQYREILGQRLFRRAKHAVTEIARVSTFAKALQDRDQTAMCDTLLASHISLQKDFEVSCAELDSLVDFAYQFGRGSEGFDFYGSRMTGGGFGGSTISLVGKQSADKYMDYLIKNFQLAYQKEIAPFETVPVAGAAYVEW